MKNYSIYVFDLDGTLVDTSGVWLKIFRDGLTAFDVVVPEDKILAKYTHDWNELLQIGLPADKLDDFVRLAHQLANERLPQTPLHIGALDMLQTLKKNGKRVAIFSTMDRAIFEPAIRTQKLDQFAEVLVAGDDVPRRKPEPDGILKALTDLGIDARDYPTAVYIGDKDTDIIAAQRAGVDGILYFPASHQVVYDREALMQSQPTAVIEHWNDLYRPVVSTVEAMR